MPKRFSSPNDYRLIETLGAKPTYRRLLFEDSPTRALPEDLLEGWTIGCHSKEAGLGRERLFLSLHESEADSWCYGDKEEMDEIFSRSIDALGDRILVSGGHYVPILHDLSAIPKRAEAGLRESITLLEKILEKKHSAGFLVVVNDVLMNGAQRRQFYQDFILPTPIASALQNISIRSETYLEVFVISENKLSERLNRERRRLTKRGQLRRRAPGTYGLDYGGEFVELIAHGESMTAKCVRSFSRLAAIPRELGFDGFVQVLPACGWNAHKGYQLGRSLYPGVPSMTLFRTSQCW